MKGFRYSGKLLRSIGICAIIVTALKDSVPTELIAVGFICIVIGALLETIGGG